MPSRALHGLANESPGSRLEPPWGRREGRTGHPPALVYGALLLVTVLGLAVRLIPMVRWPLWIDESFTWSRLDATIADYLLWRHHPEHPPLFYMLSALSIRLFGPSEWALRLPSLLASVACIPVGFLFVRSTLTTASALAFSALLAVDPVLVFQGHNARMYSGFALLTLLALWLACHLCSRDAGWRGWLLLGVGIGMTIWTHSLGLLLLVAVPLGLALAGASMPRTRAERGRWLRGALVTGAVASLFTAPLLLNAAQRASSGLASPDPQVLDAARIVFGYIRPMTDIYWLDQIVFLAGIAGVLLLVRKRGPLGWSMVALMFLTFAFVVVAALKRPEGGVASYLIPWKLCFLVGLSHLSSISVGRPRPNGLVVLAYAALVIGCLSNLRFAVGGAFWAGKMVRDLPSHLEPQDEVICYPPFVEHLCRFYGIGPRQEPCDPRAAQDRAGEHQRLWLVVAHARAEDPDLRAEIRSCAAQYGVTGSIRSDDFDGLDPSVMKVLIADGRVRYLRPDEWPAAATAGTR